MEYYSAIKKNTSDPPPRILEIKAKINKWDLIKIVVLHNKGKYKQGEKTAF